MIPIWISILWELRDYFYQFHKLLTDAVFQQAACKQALLIAPIIAGAPEQFFVTTSVFLLGALILLQIPFPEILIDSFENKYLNYALTHSVRFGFKIVYVFIYSRALDVFLLLVILAHGHFGEAREIIQQINRYNGR